MPKARPLFLLTNDDGIHAPGIRAMADALASLGDVCVVAPHVERSAQGQSITLSTPLRYETLEPSWFAVEGTPADCVILAFARLLPRTPDWVVSGINRGANLGLDVLYSGTVGAAMEGLIHGSRALAVSTHGRGSLGYAGAARMARSVIAAGGVFADVAAGAVLNLNVPSAPEDEVRGLRVASLGRRLSPPKVREGRDPRGRAYYWLDAPGEVFVDVPDSDCVLFHQGWATITALRPGSYDGVSTESLKSRVGEVARAFSATGGIR